MSFVIVLFSLSISRYRSRYKSDIAVSHVVLYITSATVWIRPTVVKREII
jgi:hypothetical protein